MRSKYFYTDVTAEYCIEFEDILDLIMSCDEKEKKQIKDIVDVEQHYDNLYDEMKFRLLKASMKKYSLEQLQERLDIKNNEY